MGLELTTDRLRVRRSTYWLMPPVYYELLLLLDFELVAYM